MADINTFNNSTVRQISEVVKIVQGLPDNIKNSPNGLQTGYKVRLTATIDDPITPFDPLPFQFEAEQVFFDGSAWVVVTDGATWDEDTILYVFDGGEVGDVLNAEALNDGANGTLWLALKSAGGESKVRLRVVATVTVDTTTSFLCDIVDNDNVVLTSDVDVNQQKFASAKFYINEIIYGDVLGSGYLADAYLAGIGVG